MECQRTPELLLVQSWGRCVCVFVLVWFFQISEETNVWPNRNYLAWDFPAYHESHIWHKNKARRLLLATNFLAKCQLRTIYHLPWNTEAMSTWLTAPTNKYGCAEQNNWWARHHIFKVFLLWTSSRLALINWMMICFRRALSSLLKCISSLVSS